MLCPNTDVCFGGIGFEQELEPFFDGGETLIEIEASHVRLTARGKDVVSKGPDKPCGEPD